MMDGQIRQEIVEANAKSSLLSFLLKERESSEELLLQEAEAMKAHVNTLESSLQEQRIQSAQWKVDVERLKLTQQNVQQVEEEKNQLSLLAGQLQDQLLGASADASFKGLKLHEIDRMLDDLIGFVESPVEVSVADYRPQIKHEDTEEDLSQDLREVVSNTLRRRKEALRASTGSDVSDSLKLPEDAVVVSDSALTRNGVDPETYHCKWCHCPCATRKAAVDHLLGRRHQGLSQDRLPRQSMGGEPLKRKSSSHDERPAQRWRK